jgi:hypothetical protein
MGPGERRQTHVNPVGAAEDGHHANGHKEILSRGLALDANNHQGP